MSTLSELLGSTTTAEKIIAAVMCFLPIATAAILIRRKNHGNNSGTAKNSGEKKSPEKQHGQCRINDIMGYDFVQIQTPCNITPDTIANETKKTQDGSQSKKMNTPGETQQRMGVTGAHSYIQDDEPDETATEREKRLAVRRQLRMEREMEAAAAESGATVLPDSYNIISNLPWPDRNIPDEEMYEASRSFGDEDTDLTEEEQNTDTEMNRLASPPESPKEYADIENITYEMMEKIANQLTAKNPEDDMMLKAFEQQHHDLLHKEKPDGEKE